jgi:hypothetical protein
MLDLRRVNFAFEHDTYCHLHNSLSVGSFILVHLIYADIVLSIAGCLKLRHCFTGTETGVGSNIIPDSEVIGYPKVL